MVRCYAHEIDANFNKIKEVLVILIEFRRVAHIILNRQITEMFKTGKISKKDSYIYKNIKTFLSERYKCVIKRQVDGIIKSYISNRKNDFRKRVYNSSLSKEEKIRLYKLNKSN